VRYANTNGLIRLRYELCLDLTPTSNIADVRGIISNKTLWMLIACMFLSDSEESMKLIVRRLKIESRNPSSSSAERKKPLGTCMKQKHSD